MIPGIGLENPPNLEPREGNDARAAAKSFEAYFFRQIFAEFRKSTPKGLFSGGMAESTFQDMLDGAMADAMAASNGTGLSKMIEREMTRMSPGTEPQGESYENNDALIDELYPLEPTPKKAPVQRPSLSVSPISDQHDFVTNTSSFGPRVDPINGSHRFHAGLDIAAIAGTPVQSSGGGTVSHAGPAGSYGNLVVVDHGNGLETRYAHLQQVDVKIGQRVNAGTEIGRVGSTGRSTGAHLHFEVRRDGKALDPKGKIPGL